MVHDSPRTNISALRILVNYIITFCEICAKKQQKITIICLSSYCNIYDK